WKEVTVRCLCAAWRPLWPECVLQRDFEGFEELEEEAVVHEIVSLGNSMGLEVDDDEVEELVEEHSKELSTEELLELHKEQNETLKRSLTSEESGEEQDKEESRIIPAKDLKDAFFCWSKLSKLDEDYHPDVGSVQKAISVFNDNVMNYFWKDQKSRKTFLQLIKAIDGEDKPTIRDFWKKFNILDAVDNIAESWDEVKTSAMNGSWKKIWPEGSKMPKRKYVTLSVNQKLELIRKLEAGASVARVCDEFGVKKQTVSDIRKAKDKLIAFFF
ncbi:Tigger transposable element-derived protein 1-like 132, partial [Homarus americanus]